MLQPYVCTLCVCVCVCVSERVGWPVTASLIQICMWISLCYVCALEQQLCLLSHVVVHGVCKRLHGMSCDQSILAQKCMCISLCVVCVNESSNFIFLSHMVMRLHGVSCDQSRWALIQNSVCIVLCVCMRMCHVISQVTSAAIMCTSWCMCVCQLHVRVLIMYAWECVHVCVWKFVWLHGVSCDQYM